MKARYYFAIAAASAALATACTSERPESAEILQGKTILVATTESHVASKTSLSDGGTTVYWNAGDAISVFTGTGSEGGYRFTSTNTSQAETASFEGYIGTSPSEYWCLYPYDKNNAFDASSGAFTFIVPDIQEAVEGSFASGLFPSVGHATGGSVTLYAVCGGIKFSVQSPGIRYIQFGETGSGAAPLNGKVTAHFGGDGKPEVLSVVPLAPFTTIIAPGGGSFTPGKYYYAVLVPTKTENAAIRFNYIMANGASASYDKTAYPGIKRAVFGVLTAIDSKAGEYKTPEPVDLGLSVKWAPFNLGSFDGNGTGFFYAWGETEPKSCYTLDTYKWYDGSNWTKYNSVDVMTELENEDDAAQTLLGNYWYMPTKAQFEELLNSENTTTLWTTQDGVSGRLVTSKINGNTLFLPACGNRDGGLRYPGVWGYCWSRERTASLDKAWYLTFTNGTGTGNGRFWVNDYDHRAYGLPVRPVWDDPTDVTSLTLDKESVTMKVGESTSIKATVKPSHAPLSWASSDDNTATVYNGVITALKSGEVTITVSAGEKSAKCLVKISDSSTGIGNWDIGDNSNGSI